MQRERLIFVMPSGGDIFPILLAVALEFEEVVIAAAAVAGIRPAHSRPRLIDGAAARLGVEEPADPPGMRIGLAAHDPLAAVLRLGEALLGLLFGKAKMPRDAHQVVARHRYDGIGAAIARAPQAVIRF